MSFINLRLKKPRIFLTQSGVDFAGYVFKQTFVLIRKKLKIRFKRAVIKYNKTNKLKYKRKISSYYGWIIHCDGIRLLKINI